MTRNKTKKKKYKSRKYEKINSKKKSKRIKKSRRLNKSRRFKKLKGGTCAYFRKKRVRPSLWEKRYSKYYQEYFMWNSQTCQRYDVEGFNENDTSISAEGESRLQQMKQRGISCNMDDDYGEPMYTIDSTGNSFWNWENAREATALSAHSSFSGGFSSDDELIEDGY